MITGKDLLVETRGGVLQVTLNRPQKRNALSRGMLAELREVFEAAAADRTLLVAVLQGAGEKCFAAGGDLRDLSSIRTQEDTVIMAEAGWAALEAVRRFPVPVIAALNGDALGGGAELALACDFRVMATHARIGFIHGHLNITTAWGGSVDLMRLLGPTTALRLLTRSELIDADTALAIGLADSVTRSADTLADTVQQFIEPIRRQVPQVARAYKAVAVAVRQGESRETLAALETRMFAETWVHEDHWAAADKILQKGGPS